MAYRCFAVSERELSEDSPRHQCVDSCATKILVGLDSASEDLSLETGLLDIRVEKKGVDTNGCFEVNLHQLGPFLFARLELPGSTLIPPCPDSKILKLVVASHGILS